MIHMRKVRREELIKQLVRKMVPPLVTLLSLPPEVQWVALRNINLLLQKHSNILSNEMCVFFCKYNDPLYVKVEKLDIMDRLASENNVDALLSELKEYIFLPFYLLNILTTFCKVFIRGWRRFCLEKHQGNWPNGCENWHGCWTLCQCFTRLDRYPHELCCARSCRCNEGQLLTSPLKFILLTALAFLPGHFLKVPLNLWRSYSHTML